MSHMLCCVIIITISTWHISQASIASNSGLFLLHHSNLASLSLVKLDFLLIIASTMNRITRDGLPLGAIMYLIHHIFLPPKLPQEDDFDSEFETILLDTVIDNLLKFKNCVTSNKSIIDSVIALVTTLRNVRDSPSNLGAISEEELRNALRDLCKKGERISYCSCDLVHSH